MDIIKDIFSQYGISQLSIDHIEKVILIYNVSFDIVSQWLRIDKIDEKKVSKIICRYYPIVKKWTADIQMPSGFVYIDVPLPHHPLTECLKELLEWKTDFIEDAEVYQFSEAGPFE